MSPSSCFLRKGFLFLFSCAFLVLLVVPAETADYSTYCQYPPYVYQSKLPSVMLLVSNSYSMSGFAYQNNTADSEENASDGYIDGHRYYGLFDPDYWYNSSWTKTSTRTSSPKPSSTSWNGSFLNWLTMRRIDVVNKLLTGGADVGQNATGYQSCGNDNTLFKKFENGDYAGTGISGNETIYAEFDHKSNCTGKNTSGLTLYRYAGTNKIIIGTHLVVGDKPIQDYGVIPENLPKAQIGLAFYNEKGDGANIAVPTKPAWIRSDWNNLKTPSEYNNEADQPLADALFTVAGYFAQVPNTDSLVNTTTLGACTSSPTPCGPQTYGTKSGYSAGRSSSSDPYYQHGTLSQCTKGYVIILTDGEPCSDGNLPGRLAHFADNTLFHCDSGTCYAAPGFSESPGPPACISRSGVDQTGREKASLEDVALWAHTTDLRNDIPNGNGKQSLDIWIVRAFGYSPSNLLKYAAINGSFDDTSGTGQPSGAYPPNQGYFESDDPYLIKEALDDIFQQLLRRATSGTAASVLASGEGSGANLVQAVFYPKRRFLDDVIDWTGTLSNFWYYIDPFFGNSSIREDSDQDRTLNLQDDNTVTFFFDPVAQVTMANVYANDNTGKPTGTPNSIPFEQVKSLWEAGKFLHDKSDVSRRIYTITDSSNYGFGRPLTDNTNVFAASRAGDLYNLMGVSSGTAADVIRYVRGADMTFRPRTVLYPDPVSGIDNTVWKLGDIVNSTPRVVASTPLNTYDKVYSDFTYKTFLNTSTYRNRGMVFAGANDGMLHAFKLGKLEFPINIPASLDKASLTNLDTSTGELGSERWAFIPRNVLPYLPALPDNNYCHLYYVDLAPQVFDASIGGAGDNAAIRSSSHWATILIGGMRFGGACRDNTATCTDCVKSPVSGGGLSSYFAMDVTNPETPSVLWEFADSSLGFATTGPAIVRINARNGTGTPDRTLKGNWYAVFGSGPTGPISNRQFLGHSDQELKLFVVDLKTGELKRTIPTGIPHAFAGSMINSTADFDLDYTDDAVYIGYIKGNGGTPEVWNQGGVLRLQTKGSVNPADWEVSKVIEGTGAENIGPVTSSVVRLQNNNTRTNWLFFGSGRYYYSLTDDPDDRTSQRKLFGIKEPCFTVTTSTGSTTINPACTDTVDPATLTNVDTTIIDEGFANTNFGFKGWYITLDVGTAPIAYDNTGTRVYQAERVITDPLATTAGVVFFTTLRPYDEPCAIGGRTFLWAVRYNTGGIPPIYALQGKALMQVSTASVEQLDLGTAFSKSVPGADASLHRGGRRSFSMEGVPPTAQGLSLLSPPPPVKRILHMRER